MGVLTEKYPVKLFAHILLILFLGCLFFGLRAGVSILSVVLFLFTLFVPAKEYFLKPYNKPVRWFIIACLLFLFLQVIAMLYTSNISEGWRNLWMKSGVVLGAVGFFGCLTLVKPDRKEFIFYYSLLLSLALLYCFFINLIKYTRAGDSNIFYYYSFLLPVRQHAIYYSVYVFSGLVMVLESLNRQRFIVSRTIYYVCVLLFIVFLYLLSSRLMIAFGFLYLLYFIYRRIKAQKKVNLVYPVTAAIVIVALFSFTTNPVSKRFTELLNGDMEIVRAEKNKTSDYFNGWQFRMLQWRIVPAILNENKAWVMGVSPGDAQSLLDQKYIQRNMYTGDPARHEEGFLGYYSHNTYLEAVLQVGLAGLLIVLFMLSTLSRIGWKLRHSGYLWIVLAVIAVSFTESLFESQYGIIMFTFISMLVLVMGNNPLKKIVKS